MVLLFSMRPKTDKVRSFLVVFNYNNLICVLKCVPITSNTAINQSFVQTKQLSFPPDIRLMGLRKKLKNLLFRAGFEHVPVGIDFHDI